MSKPGTNGHIVTVAALAEAKRLPVEHLLNLGLRDTPRGVEIPYFDAAGNEQFSRLRKALVAKEGSRHPSGVELAAYGSWQIDKANKAACLFLVEGESDCWALWHHQVPTLGLPGSGAAKTILWEHVEVVGEIYICVEPDRGGEAFLTGVRARLSVLGYKGKVCALRMPAGVKDPADLHAADPTQFLRRFEECVKAATLLEITPQPTTGAASQAEWIPPISLGDLPCVPPFPVAVLPEPARELVLALADAINIPPDFAAVPMLALTGGAIGHSRALSITRTHVQSACLFAAYVGLPGTAKSPPLKILRRPFDAVQRRFLDEWKLEMEVWEKAEECERGERPKPRRCVVSDTTTESLLMTLDDNPRGVAVIRNELAALLASMNQYKGGKGQDRQIYLGMWDGDTVVIDRKGANKERMGAPVIVQAPFISLVGNLQPDVLKSLRGESYRGVPPPDDGFLDRFLFSYPEYLPACGERWIEVPEGLLTGWELAVEKLLALPMTKNPDNTLRPFYVHLSQEAREVWEQFTNNLARDMNGEEFCPHLRGPWAKLKGYCGRLALILHYLDFSYRGGLTPEVGQISGATLARAAQLVNYFQHHCAKVHNAMEADPRITEACHVLKWLENHPELVTFSRRDVHQGLRRNTRFENPDKLDAPLEMLVAHGYIRPLVATTTKRQGPTPTATYERNPLWICPQYPQSPHQPGPSRPSEDIEDVEDTSSVDMPDVVQEAGANDQIEVVVGPSFEEGDA